jgi:hypothetical protein
VPRAPPHYFADGGIFWEHFSPEYYISVDGSEILPSQVDIINTPLYDSQNGNSHWDSTLDETDSAFSDHTLYFQPKITACDSKGPDVAANHVYAAAPNGPVTSAVVISQSQTTTAPTTLVSGAPPVTTSDPNSAPTTNVSGLPPVTSSSEDQLTTAASTETTSSEEASSTVGPPESTSEDVSGTVGPAQSISYSFSSAIGTIPLGSYVPSRTGAPYGNYSASGTATKVYTTSIVWTTSVYTVKSCEPTVTDCPNHIGHITTETIVDFTTVCPITETSTLVKTPAISVETPPPTIVTTEMYCFPCLGFLIIVLIFHRAYTYTTVCPITQTHVTGSSTSFLTTSTTSTITYTSLFTVCTACEHPLTASQYPQVPGETLSITLSTATKPVQSSPPYPETPGPTSPVPVGGFNTTATSAIYSSG